jgi:zinc protease
MRLIIPFLEQIIQGWAPPPDLLGIEFKKLCAPKAGASPLWAGILDREVDNGIKIIGTESTTEIPVILQLNINGGHRMDMYADKSGLAPHC